MKIYLAGPDVSLQIFRNLEATMDAADAIIANLTPFRGPGADPGTVYELGYMAGRGKLCLGYCNDPASYDERMRHYTEVTSAADKLLNDRDGLTVEDIGQPKNQMM